MNICTSGANYLAVVGDKLGPIGNYALRSLQHRPLAAGEVRIAVRAAGVSFVDVLVAAGRYQARPYTPFTPGSECAGIIAETGSAVTEFAVGQRVIATGWAGMFAQSVVVPESAVFPMPASLEFEEASVLAVSYGTALHALADRAQLSPGDTLLVLGAGGATGIAAVQLGRYLQARVIASASSGERRDLARAAGADAVVDGSASDWRDAVSAANDGAPIDVVFDPVGGPMTETAFRTLGWAGRHLVVGFPAGIPRLPTNLPLLKGSSLIGVNLSLLGAVAPPKARQNTLQIMALAEKGHCRPAVGRTYPLEQFADAMREAAEGTGAGRVVLQVS
jgi:NADPH2:quinone reductase